PTSNPEFIIGHYADNHIKEYLNPSLSIYYCRDFVIGESYWEKNGSRLEPLLAAKSDIVLVNSTHFAERFQNITATPFPLRPVSIFLCTMVEKTGLYRKI
ncbi:MAG: hypothetical protein LUH63_08600, partial [Parabacteroides sp.]|nr:hypothetical protein [Parabacteroides sp.]